MTPPDEASGHEGTPEHGLHDDAEEADEHQEGTYVDSQLEGDEAPTHHHPPQDGTYVDEAENEDEPPVHHDPGHGHYVDADRDRDSEGDDDEP